MGVEQIPAVVAGRYRLRDVVGAGGMGTVWRAVDEVLGREVAVKRVRLDGLPHADATLARERTMREARIAAALHHPHIVSIFDVVLEDAEPWLILEYLPSRSLGSILAERGTLPPTDVAAIGAQVAAGLAAAHQAGVVHRDVKPDNILVAHRSTPGSTGPLVKLTDFGISHAATAPVLTATEVLTGTPAYFAPETARGEGTDPRTDVYSLGAALYAAVEGHPPFGNEPGNVLALLARIGRGQAPPPRNAGHLTDLLRALTADDPAYRPTAIQAHHALLHAASPPRPAVPALAAAGPAGPVTTRRPRRRLRLAAAVGGVLALVAAGITTVVIGSTGTSSTGTAPPSSRAVDVPAGAVPQVLIDDPRTADPCALLDAAALQVYGEVQVDRDDVAFAACGADITRSGLSPVALTVVFRSPDELVLPVTTPREKLDGRDVYRFPAADNAGCSRRVMLSARHALDIFAEPAGDGPTGDLCEMAETAARGAVAALADGVIGTRPPVDTTTALGGTSACGLLRPEDLAIVPGLRSAVPGFGDWECSWSDRADVSTDVYLRFYLGKPLEEHDGTPADFAGRPGRVLAGDGDCWVQFVQREYTAEATPRVETVWVQVIGPKPGTEYCNAATALATAAATRLPPR
jgi:tRNA A-37 threonylcarbamoyl transferase component Bud32